MINPLDKRHSWFVRINMEDHGDPPTEHDVIRAAEPLLHLLYHYPETVTPIILRAIAEKFGAKARDRARWARREQLEKDPRDLEQAESMVGPADSKGAGC
jgi:hypothetical protein